MYHKGIFFIKNEDIAREYYAKAGMSFPQNEPPQPETSEPSQYVSPGHQSAGSQITEMEILDLIRDAQNCREKEDYETAKRICGSLLQQLNDIRAGQMGYQGGRSVDELEAEVKWVLAYVSYNEQRYDDMEQLLMQPQVLERHPWGTYLIALGHRMQQSDNNQMSQDLQMLIQNSQNINLTMEEKGDINVMIASLLSEGYGNAIGMSLQDAGMYYQEAANCGNEYAKEQLARLLSKRSLEMLEYHGKNGSTYSVKEERLGKGGEGSIHEIEHMPEYVAKIFKPDKRSLEREEKICNMTMNNMSEDVLQCITWPLDVLYDENDFVGYVMKRVKSVASLSELYSRHKV